MKKNTMLLKESDLTTIVAQAVKIILKESYFNEEEMDSEEGAIGKYYTITHYLNNKKGCCTAYKKLKNAQRALQRALDDEKDSMYWQKRRRNNPGKLEIIEPDYYDEEFDQAVLTPGGKLAKNGNSMNNGGFEVKYKDGTVVTVLMDEEEGDIAALDAADRFSDDNFSTRYGGYYKVDSHLKDLPSIYPDYEGDAFPKN